MVSVFTLSDAWNWLGSIPSTAGEPVCRGVDLLPPGWDGRFPGGGVFGDAPRSTPSSGCSSPFGLRLVSRLARSPRLLFLELLPRSGSEWLACFPYGWLVRQLGCLPPHFSLTFSFGVVVAPWFLVGILQRFFRVVSSCSFLEGILPPLWRWRVWMVESRRPIRSSGRFPWCLFASILFPSCATRGRFDVPGVLVSGSGLSASACSHACGRFRGIALGPGAGFPFVSLPGGRVV